MTAVYDIDVVDAVHIGRNTHRASDQELSLAANALESALSVTEYADLDNEMSLIEYHAMHLKCERALNAIDNEMFRREEFFPECSRAGMRERTTA